MTEADMGNSVAYWKELAGLRLDVIEQLKAQPPASQGGAAWNTDLDAAPGNGWQPIETAPKDGTLIILYKPDGDGDDRSRTVDVGRWGEVWTTYRGMWRMQACDGWVTPTHWMPLPKPPVESWRDSRMAMARSASSRCRSIRAGWQKV